MIMKKTVLKILPVYFFWVLITSLTWNFTLFYFFKNGITYLDLVYFNMIVFGVTAVFFLFFKKFYMKKFYIISFFLRALGLFMIAFFPYKFVFYMYGILLGLTVIFHWTPFNITYYHFASKNHTAFLSAILFIFDPIIMVFAPLISVFIIQNFSYMYLFILGALLCFIPFMFQYRLKEHVIKYTRKSLFTHLKGIKIPLVINGMITGSYWIVFPVITIYYAKNEFNFGLIFAYLGLVSVIGMILVSFFSDRKGNRTKFIYPLLFLFGISYLALMFTKSIFSWALFLGINSFLLKLISPFTVALMVDSGHNKYRAWIGREIVLSIGRLILCVILLFCIHIGYPLLVFAFLGVICFIYPYLLHKNEVYKKFEEKDYTISN